MSEVFEQEFHVRWSDLDPNMHMRHTAYGDLCAATRFSFLNSLGFTMKKFSELKIGPIIFNENLNYLSEVLPGDKVRVNVRMSGISEIGHKWQMHQEIFRVSDGKLAATLDIKGAWFNIVERKVSIPPEDLFKKVEAIQKQKTLKSSSALAEAPSS